MTYLKRLYQRVRGLEPRSFLITYYWHRDEPHRGYGHRVLTLTPGKVAEESVGPIVSHIETQLDGANVVILNIVKLARSAG